MRRIVGVLDERFNVAIVARLLLKRACPVVVASSQRESDTHDFAPLGVNLADFHLRSSAICFVRHDTRNTDFLDLGLARSDQELQHFVNNLNDLEVVLCRQSLVVECIELRPLLGGEAHCEKKGRRTVLAAWRQTLESRTEPKLATCVHGWLVCECANMCVHSIRVRMQSLARAHE